MTTPSERRGLSPEKRPYVVCAACQGRGVVPTDALADVVTEVWLEHAETSPWPHIKAIKALRQRCVGMSLADAKDAIHAEAGRGSL